MFCNKINNRLGYGFMAATKKKPKQLNFKYNEHHNF